MGERQAERIEAAQAVASFCGCCGREIEQGTDEWCIDCLREHIDTNAARPEDRTYFAQHGLDCPFAPTLLPRDLKPLQARDASNDPKMVGWAAAVESRRNEAVRFGGGETNG